MTASKNINDQRKKVCIFEKLIRLQVKFGLFFEVTDVRIPKLS
jgi:hypothetical protein